VAHYLNMSPVFAANDQVTSNIGQYLTIFSVRSIGQFFPGIWSILLIAAILLFLFLLIFGGIQWAISGDDKEKKGAAQGRITSALIGLLVVLLAWAISGLLMGAFQFPSIFQIPGGGGSGTAGQCTDKDGNPGQTCTNTNKCNIAGGCDPACCVTNGDCPGNQVCSIPNGYCKGGKSCWTSYEHHLGCSTDDRCVVVPGAGSNECSNDQDCP